jgi:hypothetical protein
VRGPRFRHSAACVHVFVPVPVPDPGPEPSETQPFAPAAHRAGGGHGLRHHRRRVARVRREQHGVSLLGDVPELLQVELGDAYARGGAALLRFQLGADHFERRGGRVRLDHDSLRVGGGGEDHRAFFPLRAVHGGFALGFRL